MAPVNAAGFFIRLAALVYDSFLVLAIWIVCTGLLMPLTRAAVAPAAPWYRIYLLLVIFPFFGWFWTHGGQTLGMRAWRLRLVTDRGGAIGWSGAALRFVAAVPSIGLFAIGLLWCLTDSRKRALHDIASRTRVVRLPPGTK